MDDDIFHITEEDLKREAEDKVIHLSEHDMKPEIVLGDSDVLPPAPPEPEILPPICPVDQQPILADQDIVACAKCGTPYHASCWQYNNGCAVFGCRGKQVKQYAWESIGSDIQDENILSSPDRQSVHRELDTREGNGFLTQLKKLLGFS